jgi:DNA-binding MarR family transcriptional regulator
MTHGAKADALRAQPLLHLRDDVLDEGAGAILAAAGLLEAAAAPAFAAAGLTPTHARVLTAVRRAGAITVMALGRAVGLAKQTLAPALAELETRGLIARQRSPRDGRERVVVLTDAGRTATDAAVRAQRARLRIAYRAAGPAAVASAIQLLSAVAPQEQP